MSQRNLFYRLFLHCRRLLSRQNRQRLFPQWLYCRWFRLSRQNHLSASRHMLKLHRRRLPNELIGSLRRTDMLIYLNLFLRHLRVYPLSPGVTDK